MILFINVISGAASVDESLPEVTIALISFNRALS